MPGWDFYRRVVEDGSSATLVTTDTGHIFFASRRAISLLGRDPTSAALPALFSAEDARSATTYLEELAASPTGVPVFFEGEATTPDGRLIYLHVTGVNLLTFDDVAGIVVTLVDATAVRQREQTLARRAMTDELTGLPNRALLVDRLGQLRRSGVAGTLVFIDVDSFKQINDVYGHNIGDVVLRAYAHRLTAACPSDATVARFGGDEFVVLLPRTSAEDAAALTRRVLADVTAPVCADGHTITGSASAGVATTDAPSSETVLREADAAMYAAKAQGHGSVVVAGPHLAGWIGNRRDLQARLRALEAERAQLRAEARTDALTRLANRRALDSALAKLEQESRDVSVLFVDIDHFGDYNHRYGDAAGDRLLGVVAAHITAGCRAGDTPFRKGGEEFVVTLPGTTLDEAQAIAGRLRTDIEAAQIPHGGNPRTPVVTVTVGVAHHATGEQLAATVDRAGTAAYTAKVSDNRNSVAVAWTAATGV